MNRISSLLILLFFSMTSIMAQVAINRTGASPDPSSIMEISSSNAGLLIPRMTSLQRVSIGSPVEGLIVYQTDGATPDFYYYRSGAWNRLNQKQAYRNEVTMGTVPIVSGNGTFGSTGITVANVSTGVMQVNHPNFGVPSPVKILTPTYNEIPSPPSIPADLCKPSFTNNCGSTGTSPNYQHALLVSYISPPYFGAFPADMTRFRLCHQLPGTTGSQCNTPIASNGDYFYYGNGLNPATYKCSFVGNAYNNTSGLNPGDSFEFFLRGQFYSSTNTDYYTALSIFIDWNRDADFFDAGESVFSSIKKVWPASYGGIGQVQPAQNVPAFAVTGDCTMRVIASKIDNNTQPCLNTAEGSAKDFSFFVINGAAPTYPAENRFCNASEETATSFRVRCYDATGTPVNNKVHILIQPF